MALPLLVSVPHAGRDIPPEVRDICRLSEEDILADRDAGARTIYYGLAPHAAAFMTSDIARACVDLNRAPHDIGGDGAIKSHTCMNVPVYDSFPDDGLIKALLAGYYFPYHEKLTLNARKSSIKLGIDCHTMSDIGPPVGPDPGRKRPLVCLSNDEGTCPQEWITHLAHCFTEVFENRASINSPFRGGYITRKHASEIPWLQIEISRTAEYPDSFKKTCVLEGLTRFCNTVFGSG